MAVPVITEDEDIFGNGPFPFEFSPGCSGTTSFIQVTEGPVTWSVSSGALPGTWHVDAFDDANGFVILTGDQAPGHYTFTLRATNVDGFDEWATSLDVDDWVVPNMDESQLPGDGTVGVEYYFQWDLTDGGNQCCFTSIVAGALPDGLTCDPFYESVAIEGTPTVAGVFTFTVRIETPAGFEEEEFSITIEEAVAEGVIDFVTEDFGVAITAETTAVQFVEIAFEMEPFGINLEAETTEPEGNHIEFTMADFGVDIEVLDSETAAQVGVGMDDFGVSIFAVTTESPEVLPPGVFQPRMRMKLYDQTGFALLNNLDYSFDCQWQHVISDTGYGKFSYPIDAIGSENIIRGQMVKCYIWTDLFETPNEVFTWRVESVVRTRISADEEFGQIVEVSGRGKGSMLEDAKIYPPGGLERKDLVDSRSFSFATPEFDDSSWPNAQEMAFFGDLTTEWTRVVDGEVVAAPLGWPILPSWNPAWIWNSISATAQGKTYFRKTFDLDISRKVNIIASGDNFWTLYLDGVALLGDNSFEDAWNEHRKVELQMDGGFHTVAAVVDNIRTSIAGLLVGLYVDQGSTCTPNADIDDGDGTPIPQPDTCVENDPLVVYVTDASWKALGYPASEPGMTPGQILNTLLAEAQARGQLLNVIFSFTNTTDSNGNLWAQMPEVSVNVGDSILDVLTTMTKGNWIDWEMPPFFDGTGHSYLFAYNFETHGSDYSGSMNLEYAVNVMDITHSTPGKLVNRYLVKYGGGMFVYEDLANQAAIGRIVEDFLTLDIATFQEAYAAAAQAMIEATAEEPAITLTLEARGSDPIRPYLDFTVADWVKAPNDHGVLTRYRTLSFTVTEDEMGDPTFALEMNRHTFNVVQDQGHLLKTLGSGVIGTEASLSDRADYYTSTGD